MREGGIATMRRRPFVMRQDSPAMLGILVA